MITALMVFHAIISVLMIIMVLLQFGKGAEAGLISGGASGEVFTGSQKGNILSRITVVLSVLFMANSILLARLQADRTSKSILDTEAPVAAPLNQDMTIPSEMKDQVEAEDTKAEKEAPAETKK